MDRANTPATLPTLPMIAPATASDSGTGVDEGANSDVDVTLQLSQPQKSPIEVRLGKNIFSSYRLRLDSGHTY